MTNDPDSIATLHAIVAVCDDWGIGLGGGMVVENRRDMRHFVACTKGHTVLMGRRTLESFPGSRALIGRCATAEVTKDHCVRPADTYFPNLDEDASWRLAAARTHDENGDPLVTPEGVAFEFDTYVRA